MNKRWMPSLIIFLGMGLCTEVILPKGMAQPSRGGTLVVGMVAEPTVLDSNSGAWNVAPVFGNILRPLVEGNDNLQIVPGMAESWNIDYKSKTYTFNLRKNIKWHDGKPFAAQDVKFTLESFFPKYNFLGMYLEGTKVDIVGDTNVVVRPGTWAPGIQSGVFASADWSMYPKHLLDGADFMKSDYRKAPVGTGPFKFKEWVRGSHITLERNDDFWRTGKPYLDKIVIKIIRDPSLLLLSLTTGEVDFVYRGLPYEAYETLRKSPNLQVILDYKPNYKVFLVSNTKHPILSNLMVRKAIMHTINKKDIAAKATSNVCRVSDRMFAPEILPENKKLTLYDYNPKKAEELLDRAGYPKKSGGVRFSLQILVRAGETDEEKTADLLKDYLKEVGIDLTIKKVDFNTNLQLQCNYQFELATQKKGNVPFFNYQQHHSSWIRPGKILSNISQYSNPKVDSLYDQWVYHATSDEERNRAILEAESILTEELPEAPLFDVAWMYVWSKRVKNAFVPARFMFQSESFEDVYITK